MFVECGRRAQLEFQLRSSQPAHRSLLVCFQTVTRLDRIADLFTRASLLASPDPARFQPTHTQLRTPLKSKVPLLVEAYRALLATDLANISLVFAVIFASSCSYLGSMTRTC